MKKLLFSLTVIGANLVSSSAFAESFDVVCRSVYNFENTITLSVADGVLVKAETFMDFSRSYGDVITVKVLCNGRTRFSYQSNEMVELFDVDASVLTEGRGALSFAGNEAADFECVR